MVSHLNFEFLVFNYCFEFPDNNKASNVNYLKTKSFVMKAILQYLKLSIYKLKITNLLKMINSIYLKLKQFLQMTNLTLIATFLIKK